MFVLFCRHFTDMYMVLRTISYASCNNPQKISWICSANHPTYDSCLTIGHNPPQNSKRSNPCYRRYFLKELKCCPSNLRTGYLFASLASQKHVNLSVKYTFSWIAATYYRPPYPPFYVSYLLIFHMLLATIFLLLLQQTHQNKLSPLLIRLPQKQGVF